MPGIAPAVARREGRNARRQLTNTQRLQASRRLCERLVASPWFRHARCIAVYWAIDNEPLLDTLIKVAWSQGKRVVLPVVDGNGVMHFRRFHRGDTLRKNRYGIPEPAAVDRRNRFVDARSETLVCAPLTAFDAQMQRVGMGSGYYDRWFARHVHRHNVRRIGIAFECQRVNTIDANPWDATLHGVVTEARVHDYKEPR